MQKTREEMRALRAEIKQLQTQEQEMLKEYHERLNGLDIEIQKTHAKISGLQFELSHALPMR